MRVNILKWLFLIFVVGIMIFAFQKINSKEEESDSSSDESQVVETEVKNDLKLGIANFDTINPIISNNKYVQDIAKIIYEPLVNITEDYNVEPGLALEWAKNGDNSYIIKLREDAKWSNGESITSYDVLYTVEKLKSLDTVYSENVKNVTKIEALSSYMVKITVDSDIPYIAYNLNFPIMCSSYYGEEDFSTSEKNNEPVASGKYKIISNSGDSIILERNENWYGANEKTPIIENITINLYSSVGELYNAFKLGQVDILSTNNTSIEDYIGTIGYQKAEFSGREYDYIAINTQNEVLQDVIVRKAINYSINKTQIVNDVYAGKYFTSDFPLDFGSWIYEDTEGTIQYNAETAKQILEENGWKYQYGYWQKYENYRTKKLSFRLLVDGSNEKRVEVANLIKSQLAEVGIVVNVVSLKDNQYDLAVQNKNYDLFLTGRNLSTSISLDTYFGEDNFANYSNEEALSILNEVKVATDEEILKEKYKRLIEIYNTDIPYISLYNNYTIVAYSTELSGNIVSNWYSMFYNIEEWHK